MASPMQSPKIGTPNRRSLRSDAPQWVPSPPNTANPNRHSYNLSRRSSQSSIRTVATGYSGFSSATSQSVCSAKFDRAYANQAHKWNQSAPGIIRHPSISSQNSIYSLRTFPPHVLGKRQNLQKQLSAVEQLIHETPNLNNTITGSIGWCLAHEHHLLNVAIKYDERARSEWEAAQDWNLSAHEGPVSKIFVTQPSRFGLTPEQHNYRIGQARKLASNAMDLWRFSDLSYQDSFKIRGAREKQSETGATVDADKSKSGKKDFQTWLKEVTKADDEGVRSIVKDDGTLDRISKLSMDEA